MGISIILLILAIACMFIANIDYYLEDICIIITVITILVMIVLISIAISAKANRELNFEQMKEQGIVYREAIEIYDSTKMNDITSSEIYLQLRNNIVKYNRTIRKNQEFSKSFWIGWFFNPLYKDLETIPII